MNNNTLSRNKLKYVENLTPIYKAVLDTIVAYAGRYDIVTLSQQTIAKMHQISVRTVSTIISYFKKLGLIQTRQRWKTSNAMVLGEAFAHEELNSSKHRLFPQYPSFKKVILSLSLIKSSVAYHYIKRMLSRIDSYMSPSRREAMEDRLVTKMRKIAYALRERGQKMTNDDALALFAFEEGLHDRVSEMMKNAKDIRFPAAFYFEKIRELAVWEKSNIRWDLVEQLRHEKFKLIPDEDPSFAKATEDRAVKQAVKLEEKNEDQVRYNIPVTTERNTVNIHKRDERKVVSFAESYRRAREVDIEKEKEGARELLRKQMEEKGSINPFAAILLGMKA